jgi:alkylated DNA repair dioxygenase AlkB
LTAGFGFGTIEQVFVSQDPSPAPTAVTWQGSLLTCGVPAVDASFSALQRVQMDRTSWVDVQPGWLQGSDEVLAELVARVSWRQRRVTMYGRLLDEPRLTAWWSIDLPEDVLVPVLADAWTALTDRYQRRFDSLGANLYRDGADSVAWHGDRIRHSLEEAVVAIVSLGEPRPFLLRPRGGGHSLTFRPGAGDLLVMGGRCQQDWEHTVPKVARAGPRLSLTFRHGAPDPTREVEPPV